MSCSCFNIENQPMIQFCISKLYFTYMTDEQKKNYYLLLKLVKQAQNMNNKKKGIRKLRRSK